jgi:glutamate racemase
MMNDTQLSIGVFDSGMGGLTVLKALRAALPSESFIYLGDTARLPYGTKSQDTVLQYAIQMTRILIERQIKALVIACNTATTASLSYLQDMLPDIPILGVVSPGAMAAVSATRNQRVAVLATETTIASQAYQKLIAQELPDATIYGRACSLLVALAEEGMTDNAIAREALSHYLQDLSDQDTLLLGCTHFPVFKPLLTRLLPSHVAVVDSAEATSEVLKSTLLAHQLLNNGSTRTRETRYLVTDSVHRFRTVGELFLGDSLKEASVELVDVKSAS